LYADWEARWRNDPNDVGKYPVVRDVLNRLNERNTDSALRERREIIKRVTTWENFATLWEKDRLPAKGLVADIRDTVHKTDAFTRMERKEKRRARQTQLDAMQIKREQRESIRKEIGALFRESNHQKRGKALEGVLNGLFASFDILVREAFTIRGTEGDGIIAQIDGVIELDNIIYLVEMKWVAEKIGPADIGQHVTRVLHRSEAARGLFVSATDYTPAARTTLRDALNWRIHVATGLHEIIFALEKEADIRELLRKKVQAATIDTDPFHFVG
jgi:restriction system protein